MEIIVIVVERRDLPGVFGTLEGTGRFGYIEELLRRVLTIAGTQLFFSPVWGTCLPSLGNFGLEDTVGSDGMSLGNIPRLFTNDELPESKTSNK